MQLGNLIFYLHTSGQKLPNYIKKKQRSNLPPNGCFVYLFGIYIRWFRLRRNKINSQ
jgi:hypothetical protein